jgi:hypothetical protein
MALRYFALIYGIVFVLVGVAGFIPALVTPADEFAASADGRLFGLFPVNTLHNIVHLAFGAWGLAAYLSTNSARVYARSVAIIYGVLAIMGMIPALRTLFGLVPLYGHDIWLHAALAIVAAYFGFASRPAGSGHTMAHSGR